MSFYVTLQLPVRVHGNAIRMFRRPRTELQIPPYPAIVIHGTVVSPGTLLTGLQLPSVLRAEHGAATMVLEVGEDLDKRETFVTLQGTTDVTRTAEEFLQELNRNGGGWELVDQPIVPPPTPSP